MNDTGAATLGRLHELMPPGVSLMTGASATLREIGLETELANETTGWNWLKAAILVETDSVKRTQLRLAALQFDSGRITQYLLAIIEAVIVSPRKG